MPSPPQPRTAFRRRWLTIAAVAGLFILPAALSRLAGGLAANTIAVGHPVPAFTAPTLNDETVSTDDLTGRVTVINFWATWCGPCRAEMPLLDAAHDPANGVQVWAVNNAEPAGDVAAFADEFNLTLPVLLDPTARLQREFNVAGYPTTVFVGPDGVIYAVHTGPLTACQLADHITTGSG